MSKTSPWGSALQAYRKKAQLTQVQFIEELSLLISHLSEDENDALVDAQIYEEASSYFGGVLDAPTLSRLENGTRALNLRQRCVALVWGLKRLEVLDTVEEANHFLELGGHGNLTAAEHTAIFEPDLLAAQVADPSLHVQVDPPGDRSAKRVDITHRQSISRRIAMGIAGCLLLAAIALGIVYLRSIFERDLSGEATGQIEQIETRTIGSTNSLDESSLGENVQKADQDQLAKNESTSQSTSQIKQHALLVDQLLSDVGTIGNGQTFSNLHELDLQGEAEVWGNYVKFFPTDTEPYLGYRVFSVPQHIPRAAVSAMRVKANYRGPALEGQAWVWRIFNSKTKTWERLGDNRDAPWWGSWYLLSFDIAGEFADYINAEDELMLQVQASNESDGMDLDYEAIIIEWKAVP